VGEVALVARELAGVSAQARRHMPLGRVQGHARGKQHDRLRRQVAGLLGYLGRNEAALVPYVARRRRGEPIATLFMESAVDEIIAWRMAKKQQMRWTRATVQPSLDVRTAVLNGTLEDVFRRRHPGFRPANDDRRPTATAA